VVRECGLSLSSHLEAVEVDKDAAANGGRALVVVFAGAEHRKTAGFLREAHPVRVGFVGPHHVAVYGGEEGRKGKRLLARQGGEECERADENGINETNKKRHA